MVQDPNFWKRFSTAVHADEVAKEGSANLKHSYVPSQLSLDPAHTPHRSSAPVLPPLSPSFAATESMQSLSPVISAPASALPPPSLSSLQSQSRPKRKEEWEKSIHVEIHSTPIPTSPLQEDHQKEAKPKRHSSNKLRKSPSTRSTHPLLPSSHEIPLPPPPPARTSIRCPSALSLNLTGRSKGHFRTWTTITANPARRDSWLASQKKKSRQRTWMCWCFWLVFLLLVAGVVVTILVLKAHNII